MVEFPRACISCGRAIPNQAHAAWCPRGRAWKTRPKKNQQLYSGDWPVLVKQILRRDPWCMLRGTGCERLSVEVDHIVAVSDGGTNDPENLRGVCKRCHARRTGQQGARAANAKRRKQRGIERMPRPAPGAMSRWTDRTCGLGADR